MTLESVELIGICLPSRAKRFLDHVQKRGLCVNVINAVQSVKDERIKQYDYDSKNKNNLCTLSHLLALEKFVNSDKQIGIVLEDDINLHYNFLELVNELIRTESIAKHGVISLGYLFSKTASTEAISKSHVDYHSSFSIGKNAWVTYGTQAYTCSRNYAVEVLRLAKSMTFLSPENMILSKNTLDIQCCKPLNRVIVYPPFALERFDLFGTALNHHNNIIFFNNVQHILKDYS